MLASTWMDPVLGLDIHIVGIPAPPAPLPVPTPIPMPFVGMVFDPLGMAVGLGMAAALGGPGPVMVNGLPATNCGTNVTNMLTMPHLPAPGVIFIPPPKPGNDAELYFGSNNATFGGSLAVRLGDVALSCSDPVRMPTSLVLAIPKGMPVLVMRPMVPDLTTIAFAAAFRALGAALRAGGRLFRAMQRGSSRWARLSHSLHELVERISPQRFRDRLGSAVCFLTGHPVDVASGRVLTQPTDFFLNGPLPLRFERSYSSSLSYRKGPLGHGWSHSLDQAVWTERGRVVYLAEDGREIEFSTLDLPDHVLRAGEALYQPLDRLTLRNQGQGRWEIESADGRVRSFAPVAGATDKRSRLLALRTRAGDEQRYAYDRRARLETVRDTAGRLVVLEHDDRDRLVRVSVAPRSGERAELRAQYAYDEHDDLIEARDAAGQAHRFEYATHLLVRETNRNGLSFYFQYDGLGASARCVRTWGDGGIYDHELTYDLGNRKTLVEDSLGNVTVYQMDATGQVVSQIDAAGGVTQYEYDPRNGLKCKETHPSGAETVWEYDDRGNCVKTVAPDGAVTRLEFDDRNLAVRVVDPLGGVWAAGYDRKGRLEGRVDPLGRRSQFEWDGGRLLVAHDTAGQLTRLGYDDQGNLASLTSPDGRQSQWRHDGFGRVRVIVDPKGNTERREYNALGRPEEVVGFDGAAMTLRYDAEGNVVRATDGRRDVRFTYQGMNRLASRTEQGKTVRFHYDTEERLIAVENEHGLAYRFVRGPTGAVLEEHGFDGLRRVYQRDPAGRVTKLHRPQGKTTAFTYDPAGRVIAQVRGDVTETFTYRPDGALIEATKGDVTVTLERDLIGRVVRELQGDDWVSSEYDALDRRVRVRSSKGLDQKIRRGAMGDVLAVTADVSPVDGDPERVPSRPVRSFVAEFSRDALGEELERTLPGGVRTTWERDALGRPVRQELWTGRGREASREYTWEPRSQLRAVVDAALGPIAYEHDALGQLVSAVYEDGKVDLRLPDAVGNLFRSSDGSDRRYGPSGELLEARGPLGVTTYRYDPEGYLVEKVEPGGQRWRYGWDGAGMLARVDRPDGGVVTLAYDPFGRRISKTLGARTTRWIWDDHVPLHEWVEEAAPVETKPAAPLAASVTGAIAADHRRAELSAQRLQGPPPAPRGTAAEPITWLFEPGGLAPLAMLVGNEHLSFVTDHLGVPTELLDAKGEVVWSARLDVHGQVRDGTGDPYAVPFRWPGQYADAETGLHYNRFRYYDPEAGEYISRDPIGLQGGLRLHGYVRDPLTWADPLGLAPCATWNEFQQRFAGRFSSRAEAAAAWRVYKQSATSMEELAIGRLVDTEAAERLGMRRLNDPAWTLAVNDAWIQGGIDANRPFYLATEPNAANLFNPPGSRFPTTVFHREMGQITGSGYTRAGDYMIPP